jgi:hypothetical protein
MVLIKIYFGRFYTLDYLESALALIAEKSEILLTYQVQIDEIRKNQGPHTSKRSVYLQRNFLKQADIAFDTDLLNPFSGKIAIIIQGPIEHLNRYTYLTVLRYLEIYKGAKVIVSTWENESTAILEALSEENSDLSIVKSKSLEFSGIFNINSQIVSTQKGIALAKSLGCEFVIKSRSDQRFFNPLALHRLNEIYQKYSKLSEKSRIIGVSLNTFLFRMYGFSDMFQFGETEVIEKYWSAPLDLRKSSDLSVIKNINLRKEAEQNVVEVYLTTHYLELCGLPVDFTFEQSLKAFRDYFIIMDANSFHLNWNRHSLIHDRWQVSIFPSKNFEITFLDWLEMQDSILRFKSMEYLLDDSSFYDK